MTTDASSAPRPAFASALDAFRAAVAAVNRTDWAAVAASCDPASLSAFRRQLIDQYDRTEPQAVLTVEEYLRHSPEMPRAVAEYHVAQHRLMADPLWRMQQELPGVEGVEQLKQLGPEEVFARWLDGRTPRRQIERMIAEGRIGAASAELTLEQVAPALHYEPIGVLADGDRVAHVLYRPLEQDPDDAGTEAAEWMARMPPDERELTRDLAGRQHPMVATCRRQPDGSWRLIAGYGFLMLGSITICVAPEDGEPTH